MMQRSKYQFLFIIIALCTLQACKVVQDYEAPDLTTIELVRHDSLYQDSISLGQISWRTFFVDSIMRSYIDSAVLNNFDVQQAEKRIDAALAYYLQNKQAWLPGLDGHVNATHQKISENSRFGGFGETTLTQYEIGLTTTWELDIWGKIKSQRRAGEANYMGTITAKEAIVTQLISQLANTYIQLVAADERRAVILESIHTREQSLQIMQYLKDAGETTALAVNQAAAQVDESYILYEQVKDQIFVLENTLMFLLGQPRDSVPRSDLRGLGDSATITLGIPALFLSRRPDVRQAEYDFRYFFEQHNIAIASMYPTLRITGGIGLQSLDPATWFDLNSLFANVIGGVTQPIFQKRQLKTQEEVSQAQMEEAFLRFQATAFQAGIEVRNALNDYRTQQRIQFHRQKQVDDLEFALENANDLLKAGLANYLEVLDIQQNILTVKLLRINDQAAKLQALTELYRSLGGGVD